MERYNTQSQADAAAKEIKNDSVKGDNYIDIIKKDVLSGSKRTIVKNTQKAIEEGVNPKQILDEALMPAINEVGDYFDKGKYFLPQLIAGAEAMKLSIGYLEPLLAEGSDSSEKTLSFTSTS